ncbi:MAG: hypothetical protein ACM3OO_11105 [Planctomycetaceae bacterium]
MRGRTETERLVVSAIVAAAIGAVGLAAIIGVWPGALLSGVPVVVALVPMVVRRRRARIASAALLWATCVLAGTSFVGILLVPAAIVMTVAATRRDEPVSAVRSMRGRTNADVIAAAAFVVAVVGALVAAFAPLGRSCSSTAVVPALGHGSPAPSVEEACHGVSSFSIDGSWVLVVVSVPVLVALIPVLVRRRRARIVSAVLLWAGCVVGMWSVGMFFVPAAIVMTVAAARDDHVPAMPPA